MTKRIIMAALFIALPSVAEAACIWSRELSEPHAHPIFCATPDDPDLARIIGHIGRYETAREIRLDSQVYLIERRPDGITRRTEPYRLVLITEARRKTG